MPTIEAPTLEGFEPVSVSHVMGIGHVTLQSPDGVRLHCTEPGVPVIDADPQIAALLGRMGAFIAEHDGYREVEDVKEAEPCSILGVANPSKGRDGYKIVLASVYHPEAAPGPNDADPLFVDFYKMIEARKAGKI